MALGVTTLLVVQDLKISKQFYMDILGLEFVSEQENDTSVNYHFGYESNSTLVFTIHNLDKK